MAQGVRRRLLACALLAICVAVGAQAHAQAAGALTLTADHPERGWIRLRATGPDGTTVDLAEQTAAGQAPIGEYKIARGSLVVRHAEIWRCDRYDRHFVAIAALPDGTTQTAMADVQTPSCAKRMAVSARVVKRHRARTIRVELRDRFGVGDVSPDICVVPPGRRFACHKVRLPAGRTHALLSYRAGGPGLWSIVLQTSWKQGATLRTYVRPAGTLHLLATGDSMIEGLDGFLKTRLARSGFKVSSDARISTGISKPFLLDWTKLAKRQARKDSPDATVVFIGANDGYPIGGANCCGEAWINAYETRVQAMMTAWSRGGRGLVYWLTLPAPKPAQWKPVYPAVNAAVHRAAAGFAGQIHVVDIDKVLSPGFVFRNSIVWQGHRQVVRQGDGIHLSLAGESIAEALIERAMQADGVL